MLELYHESCYFGGLALILYLRQASDYTPPAPITMPLAGGPEQQQQQQPQQQQYQQQQQSMFNGFHHNHF